MKAIYLCIVMVFLNTGWGTAAEFWGRTGHRATGEIAEKHLSNKAQKKIKELLDGASLAFVSTFADEIKSDEKYRPYSPWHYVNFPFDSTYEDHPKSDRGDIVQAIDTCIKVLKDASSSKEDKAFHLKLLVHFMGDLHQPLHVGKAEDKGANTFQVRWFDDGTNLHTVWDTKMIESYNMSYSELASNADMLSKEEIEALESGTVTDWMYESRELCLDIYKNTDIGEKLGYRYMYRYMNVMRGQLQKGGIRLAHVLNDIFG
ncbi:S1/P1 nuclease [Aureisphaera galaxeae]|uniref:S1/P1 nuclease n=1 Tax=Aureisphaera galaxeae TaxID=1538023 RepID=UPI00235040B9|nr:S1/P1 nuclease [Aureisphaera galaxeae]MDC8004517.1 S1/P1 nuclease [Aureisphaera galaxeae]